MKAVSWLLAFLIAFTIGSELPETNSNEEYELQMEEEKPKRIVIGLLTSFEFGVGRKIIGALPYAVERVNNDSKLLPNHTLEFIFEDYGQPGTPATIMSMARLKERGAVAFIGPEVTCNTEALLASAWNLPMITYQCADRKLSNKSIYWTFARTLPPSSMVSKSVITLLKHFNWYKIMLLVSDNPPNRQIEEALLNLFRKYHITVTATHYLPSYYLSSLQTLISDIIEKTYRITRVYVILSEEDAVIDFIRKLAQLARNINEYVVICVAHNEQDKPGNYYMHYWEDVFAGDSPTAVQVPIYPYSAVLVICSTAPVNPDYTSFQIAVEELNRKRFKVPYSEIVRDDIPLAAGLAYDAVMIYATALTMVLKEGGNVTDGRQIVDKIKGLNYESILGFNVAIDQNADAEGNFTLLSLNKSISKVGTRDVYDIVGKFIYDAGSELPQLLLGQSNLWLSGSPPVSEPPCGFSGEKCQKTRRALIIFGWMLVSAIIIGVTFAFRHYRYEHKLACLLWKVDLKDVVVVKKSSVHAIQLLRSAVNVHGIKASNLTRHTISSMDTSVEENHCDQAMDSNTIGFYKGSVVFVKRINKKTVDLTRTVRKELIQMKKLRHENINPFIGASTDNPYICILTLYCARGSLKDILHKEDLNLDTIFVASLVADLIKGMIYLHDSEIGSHGRLKPSNCLVDTRWVLQITDFGLHAFRSGEEWHPSQREQDLLWTAPEHLRQENPPPQGSQKGDVFSFALILYEIITRQCPWTGRAHEPRLVLDRLKHPCRFKGRIYRPALHYLKSSPEYIVRCIEMCWHENPEMRPDFRYINSCLREMQKGLKPNIFDNMMAMMEQYAYNLEGLVEKRTAELMIEKSKTENLLLRMLPKSVSEQLMRGDSVKAESFDCVTIYFSDIVGFTELSAVSTPLQIVTMLNDLYTCFDSIIGNYDVYKVETIGDAYMVVSGLPIRNGKRHASEIASMALHLLSAINSFEIKHRKGERLKLRIGIHSGQCAAGVVGLKMPRYCLFGDTVNTASRMESTGEALKIHVSSACKSLLDDFSSKFILKERGLIDIKGKGLMRTYWLLGKAESLYLRIPSDTHIPAPCDQTTESYNIRKSSSEIMLNNWNKEDEWKSPSASEEPNLDSYEKCDSLSDNSNSPFIDGDYLKDGDSRASDSSIFSETKHSNISAVNLNSCNDFVKHLADVSVKNGTYMEMFEDWKTAAKSREASEALRQQNFF